MCIRDSPVSRLWPRLWNGRHAQTRLAQATRHGFDPAQLRPSPLVVRRTVTLIIDPLFYALAIPAVVALGLSKGGFVGVGQIGTPLLALVMPPLEAAAILLPIMLAQDAVSVWAFRKDWSG